jgi:FkbM family methyltransferase
MRIRDYLNKSEYLHRPTQVFRRIWRGIEPLPATARVSLPWGFPLNIHPGEVVGRALWLTGAFELAVSEMIWRILRPGDLAADVGANIGYHTSLMALRVSGRGGVVRAFEPHPVIFGELTANLELWPSAVRAGVCLTQAAVSSAPGEVTLHIPREFSGNRGVASVEAFGMGQETEQVSVKAVQLDAEFAAAAPIRLLKMDVEGHELAALAGAQRLLREGGVRSVIFEEHSPLPSPVSRVFTGAGYRLFKILKSPGGPRLEAPDGPTPNLPFEAPNYLATLEAEEMQTLAEPRGWQCLG